MEKEYKVCPHCGKEILSTAKKCKYCKEWLDGSAEINPEESSIIDAPDQYEKQDNEVIDRHESDNKKRNIWTIIVIAVISVVIIILGLKACDDKAKKEAEENAKAEAEYAEWLHYHSYAGIDYRNYSKFNDYIKAVLDKKGSVVFKGNIDGKPVKVVLYGNPYKAHVEDEQGEIFDGYQIIYPQDIELNDAMGQTKYRVKFDDKNPEAFKTLIYIKRNGELNATALYRVD